MESSEKIFSQIVKDLESSPWMPYLTCNMVRFKLAFIGEQGKRHKEVYADFKLMSPEGSWLSSTCR